MNISGPATFHVPMGEVSYLKMTGSFFPYRIYENEKGLAIAPFLQAGPLFPLWGGNPDTVGYIEERASRMVWEKTKHSDAYRIESPGRPSDYFIAWAGHTADTNLSIYLEIQERL